jgi:membrane protease YdiL (CAAX protease family)
MQNAKFKVEDSQRFIMANKKILVFIALTFSCCWLIALLFYIFNGEWNTTPAFAAATLYMFIPLVMTIVVQKCIYKQDLKKPLEISFKFNRWFLIAWLLPFFLALITFGISLTLPGVELSLDMKGMFERYENTMSPEKVEEFKAYIDRLPVHPIWISILQAFIAGISINALFAFGEELGWRGLLQKEMAGLGFLRSSLLIGIIWGLWHAPIILMGHNYPQHPKTGVFMMVILCILLSPVFSYVRLRAKSVIAAGVIHGSFNASPGIALMLIKGGSDLTVGITGISGITALLIINIGLLVYDTVLADKPLIFNTGYK